MYEKPVAPLIMFIFNMATTLKKNQHMWTADRTLQLVFLHLSSLNAILKMAAQCCYYQQRLLPRRKSNPWTDHMSSCVPLKTTNYYPRKLDSCVKALHSQPWPEREGLEIWNGWEGGVIRSWCLLHLKWTLTLWNWHRFCHVVCSWFRVFDVTCVVGKTKDFLDLKTDASRYLFLSLLTQQMHVEGEADLCNL